MTIRDFLTIWYYPKKMKKIILIMFILLGCSRNEFVSKFNNISSETKLLTEFEISNYNESPFILIGKDKDNNQLKIRFFENVSKDAVNSKIKQLIYLYNTQFEFTTAPYPGQITTATNCGQLYRPTVKSTKSIKYVAYFANSRLGLTICDSDEYNYYQYLFFLQNGQNGLIAVDYYSTKSLNEDELTNLIFRTFEKPTIINYE